MSSIYLKPAEMSQPRVGTATYRFFLALVFSIGLFGYPAILNTAIAAGIDSRTVTVPYRVGFAGFAFLVALASWKHKALRLNTPFTPWLITFLALYTVRILFDNLTGVPYLDKTLPVYLGSLFVICVIPSLAFAVNFDGKTAREIFNVTLIVGLFVAGSLAFSYQGYLGTNFGRLKGFDGQIGPIIISKYGCALVLIGAYGVLTPKIQKAFTFPACIAAMAGGGIMLVLGSSRGPALAMMFGLGLLSYARFRGKNRTRIIIALAVLACATPFLLEKAAESGGHLISRIMNIGEQMESRGMEAGRLIIWEDYIKGFFESPIIGKGLESRVCGIGHNLMLDAFYNTGILGGIPFAFVFLGAFWKAWRILVTDEFVGWIALYFCYTATHCMVSEGIYYVASWWYPLFFVLAYPMKTLKKNSPQPHPHAHQPHPHPHLGQQRPIGDAQYGHR